MNKNDIRFELLLLTTLLRTIEYTSDNLILLESLKVRNQLHIVSSTIKETMNLLNDKIKTK